MSMLWNLLVKVVPFKEIGWKDIGETFYRFQLLRTPWFNVYLHVIDAPEWHLHCHDHPWNFWAMVLWNGYVERTEEGEVRRRPGSVFYRRAEYRHNVRTDGWSWSLVVTSKKVRGWKVLDENDSFCRPDEPSGHWLTEKDESSMSLQQYKG